MTLYSLALFLHIVGALGFFAALALDWLSTLQLRRAETAEKALEWARSFAPLGRLFPISSLMILIPGIYMTAVVWGGVGWIVVSLVTLFLLPILGVAAGRQLTAIEQAAAVESGPVSLALSRRLRHPLVWSSLQVRTAAALGIVFLMTVKPGLEGSLLTIGVAVVLGLVSSVMWGRGPAYRHVTRRSEA